MFATPSDIERFATAGKATLTFESLKSGAHYTFKITKATGPRPVYFVNVLTGPNNEADYTYLGILKNREFQLTAKSKMTGDSKPVAAFKWVWNAISAGDMPRDCAIHHEGKCGRCARKLTTPASINLGIGPECASKMGLAYETGPAWF